VSASLTVDLIEADFLGIGSDRVQSDRAGNKRKAQKAFPVGAGGHLKLHTLQNSIQDDLAALVPTSKWGSGQIK
jgi:hypothetical protein